MTSLQDGNDMPNFRPLGRKEGCPLETGWSSTNIIDDAGPMDRQGMEFPVTARPRADDSSGF